MNLKRSNHPRFSYYRSEFRKYFEEEVAAKAKAAKRKAHARKHSRSVSKTEHPLLKKKSSTKLLFKKAALEEDWVFVSAEPECEALEHSDKEAALSLGKKSSG